MLSLLLRPRLASSTIQPFFTTIARSSSSSSSTIVSSAPVHVAHRPKDNKGLPMREGFNEKGHKILSDADIAEIKRLRALDPTYWGQARLATRCKEKKKKKKKFAHSIPYSFYLFIYFFLFHFYFQIKFIVQCSRLMVAKHAPATEERRTIAKRKIQMEYDMARANSVEIRKARRTDWYARQTDREHALWMAKLEQKAVNKAANEAAHEARMKRKADAAARQYKSASAAPQTEKN
jgi:hypothetical protein